MNNCNSLKFPFSTIIKHLSKHEKKNDLLVPYIDPICLMIQAEIMNHDTTMRNGHRFKCLVGRAMMWEHQKSIIFAELKSPDNHCICSNFCN
uniref:Uncharacterized protein n=1 Tax=Rhizophora mucronata TaxID=61149 RepID=A0A2P2PB31_RHIMU